MLSLHVICLYFIDLFGITRHLYCTGWSLNCSIFYHVVSSISFFIYKKQKLVILHLISTLAGKQSNPQMGRAQDDFREVPTTGNVPNYSQTPMQNQTQYKNELGSFFTRLQSNLPKQPPREGHLFKGYSHLLMQQLKYKDFAHDKNSLLRA